MPGGYEFSKNGEERTDTFRQHGNPVHQGGVRQCATFPFEAIRHQERINRGRQFVAQATLSAALAMVGNELQHRRVGQR